VIEIPTNLPCIRIDNDDEVYRTTKEKLDAILDAIEDCHARKQPILVGTVSIEKSEVLSGLLKKRKVPHQVLNARYHEQEAYIIAQAGAPGAVTIATNMAGRGTDIQLGGNFDMRVKQEAEGIEDEAARAKKIEKIREEIAAARDIVLGAGGVMIMGTERHESRRIDNQLRGRSGRQGDPGASKFFLSLEDDLMRIFGSERMDSMLRKLGLEEGEAIVHSWVNKALEKAQEKVEARNFEIRKNLLKYDDVMNDQRKVVYEQRKDLMRVSDVHDTVSEMRHDVIEAVVARHIPPAAYAEQWDTSGLHAETLRIFGLDLPIDDWAVEEGIADQEIRERITVASNRRMAAKLANYGEEIMRSLEKQILLMVLDKQWKDHLLTLDHLRHGIFLRAYGQRDPLNEYKREAFELFEEMLGEVRDEVTMLLSRIELQAAEPEATLVPRARQVMHEGRQDPALAGAGAGAGAEAMALEEVGAGAGPGLGPPPPPRPVMTRQAAAKIDPNDPATWGKVPRNAPCPCGSGRKYKHCHGKLR
jgi:preprotein translocase subunit SecA